MTQNQYFIVYLFVLQDKNSATAFNIINVDDDDDGFHISCKQDELSKGNISNDLWVHIKPLIIDSQEVYQLVVSPTNGQENAMQHYPIIGVVTPFYIQSLQE